MMMVINKVFMISLFVAGETTSAQVVKHKSNHFLSQFISWLSSIGEKLDDK